MAHELFRGVEVDAALGDHAPVPVDELKVDDGERGEAVLAAVVLEQDVDVEGGLGLVAGLVRVWVGAHVRGG